MLLQALLADNRRSGHSGLSMGSSCGHSAYAAAAAATVLLTSTSGKALYSAFQTLKR